MKLSFSASMLAVATAGSVAAQDVPQAGNEWFTAGQERIRAELAKEPIATRAKNVILMISDGNGVGTNYASRLFAGQQAGGYGDEYVQPHEAFPNLALVKTYNTNAQTPDSAGTGTAMMSGVKTKAGVIGVDEDVVRGDCSTIEGNRVTPLSVMMDEMGKAVGVVSTARITHATPASVYAQTADRNWEDAVPEGCTAQVDIAQQLLNAMTEGRIDVAMGGGRRHFLPEGTIGDEGTEGRRADARNLIEEAQEAAAQYAWDSDTFAALDLSGETPILGLFEDSHMQYEADRSGEPSLAEMTAAAIEALQGAGGDEGFFLMVEAGRVDHANHAGNLARTVRDQKAFADAVAMADEMTDDGETLIVVTADHEHAVAFNGYCGRGSDILGLCMQIDPANTMHADEPNLASDELPYTVAGFLNGAGSVLVEQLPEEAETSAIPASIDAGDAQPGEGAPIYSGDRRQILDRDVSDIDYLQQALIPMSSETHSGEDVAVYAKGPYAYLFDGTIEQNVIFHVMHHAATAE